VRLLHKSATVAENGETTATVAEFGDSQFGDSRTFLRQCGQGFTPPWQYFKGFEACFYRPGAWMPFPFLSLNERRQSTEGT